MSDIPSIGEVLRDEFMKPFGLSQNALAKALGIPQNRISEIVSGRRGGVCGHGLAAVPVFRAPGWLFCWHAA